MQSSANLQKIRSPMTSILTVSTYTEHDRVDGWSVARTRMASAARLTAWCTATSSIGGALLGLLLAAGSALAFRSLMGLREWCDVLSYSVLAHAGLWTLYGLMLSAVAVVALMVRPRWRLLNRPALLALSAFLAGVATMLLWTGAIEMGLIMAVGIRRIWLAPMLVFWTIVFGRAYRLLAWMQGGRLARLADVGRRITAGAGLFLISAAGGIQWYEWPRMLGNGLDRSAWAGPDRASAHGKPNVVLIVMDTQRADRLGCYGHTRPTTPKIDAFAADAHLFENATSTAGWTLPSHASMFTGLFPSEHGTHRNHRWLDDGYVTMAEILDEADYQTVAFSNNPYISDTFNTAQGFDRVFCPVELHEPRSNLAGVLVKRIMQPAGLVGMTLAAATNEDAGGKFTTQLVRRWLKRRDVERPFFLFVNLLEPHDPYEPHHPHRRALMDTEELDRSYEHTWAQQVAFSLLKRDCYSAAELDLLNKTYDAETRMVDDYVGQIIDSVARQADLDNTLVILTADHGENLGDHHLMGHQWCVYQTLTHVPLIVRFPKRIRPGRSDRLVQNVDLLPTVVDAVWGSPMPTASTSGRSLFPPPGHQEGTRLPQEPAPDGDVAASARSDEPDAARPSRPFPTGRLIVSERIGPMNASLWAAQRHDPAFDKAPYLGVLRSIRQGDWKVIVHADGREELYHLADDPGETDNLVAAHRPIADHLAGRLRDWLAARKAYDEGGDRPQGTAHDERVRRRLRSLGYIE